MQDFAGKVAVVTGAASGIGLGLARAFTRAGMYPDEAGQRVLDGIRTGQFF